MTTPARFLSRDNLRQFLWLQLTLVAIALVIRGFFWATGSPTSSRILFTATLVVGNLANVFFRAAQPLFARIPRRWKLMVQLSCQIVFSISAGLLTLIGVSWHYSGSGGQSWLKGTDIRLSLFLIFTINVLVFGTVFVYVQMKTRLEERNRELQGQVQLGQVQRQKQEAELDQAHEIQMHLLPRETPQIEGFQIACAWQPAKAVSGDYFDVFPFKDGRMALCLADVSGKGMAAALLMANLQASVRAFGQEDTTPAMLCAKVNSALCANIAPGKFVTFFYAIIDAKTRRMQYENAGHCLPLLVHADGRVEMPASYSGVLGLFSHWTYQDSELQLAPGDSLLLLTDGVLEAANGDEEEYGYQRLIQLVERNHGMGAHALRRLVLEDVSAFCKGAFQDDASLIVVTLD